ncbi:FtsX-like permease family protein [Kitasatospora arboriphila]
MRLAVLAEALVVGAVASAAGCVLGRLGAPAAVRWLTEVGMAPPGFTVDQRTWPLAAAFLTGLLVALGGVLVAARRAGRLGPLDALRSADLDTGVMTTGRWIWGLGLLAVAAGLIGSALLTDPVGLLHRKTYTVRPMVLVSACGLLAPALARPLLRLLGRLAASAVPLVGPADAGERRRRGAPHRGDRRAGAGVGRPDRLAGWRRGHRERLPDGRGPGADRRRLRPHPRYGHPEYGHPRYGHPRYGHPRRGPPGAGRVPADASRGGRLPTGPTRLALVEPDGNAVRSEARTADPAALAGVARLPVVAGSVAALTDDGIVLPLEWGHRAVGDPVPVVLADGRRVTLRVAAVLRDGLGDNGLYVTAANAPGSRTDRIDVRSAPGSDRVSLEAGLRATAARFGARVDTRERWLAATAPANGRTARLRIVLVLGLALTYTGIALVNILAMATADRRRELALLRLTGATRTQVVGLVTGESLLVVAVGALLGCAVAAVQLGAMNAALALLGSPPPLVLPWRPVGAVTAACLLLAAPGAALAALRTLRPRPVDAARG